MMPARILFMIRLLGGRPGLFFGLVTLLAVALLAAIQVTSRYALKTYADDQIRRVAWDISVYQPETTGLPLTGEVRSRIAALDGVAEVANIYFLRTAVPTARSYVDGEVLRTPWVSVLMVSDPALLPQEIRPGRAGAAVLALLGKKSLTGDAYLGLQGTHHFQLSEATQRRGVERRVFDTEIERVVRVERDGLNRWFMDQTSSPTFVPDIGVVLVMPFDPSTLLAFDAVGRGIELAGMGQDIHELAGKYVPEVIHLVRMDRHRLVSTWDLEATSRRAGALAREVRRAAELHPGFTIGVDNTTGVLFARMAAIAEQIGLLVLLVALPLLWIAWVLLANLARLIMLNERRLFGLLRLRGAPGRLLAWCLLAVVAGSGLVGAVLGYLIGTYLPLSVYAGGNVKQVASIVQSPGITLLFILLGVSLALAVAWPLAAYAARIAPVEGAAQVAASETRVGAVRFGWFGALALFLGSAKLAAWIAGWRLLPGSAEELPLRAADRALDFVAFPLLIYGLTALVASRHRWLIAALRPFARLRSREMAGVVLSHVAAKPHRASSLVLIVALMASVSLYPTVLTAVFDDKIERAALVQLGGELQVTLNVPDLLAYAQGAAPTEQDALAQRFTALRGAVADVRQRLEALPQVAATTFVTEGLVEGLYMPGYGLEGVPVYFIDEAAAYLQTSYHESALGVDGDFEEMIRTLESPGRVLMSPPLWTFWGRDIGEQVPVGRDRGGNTIRLPAGGAVEFLPGGIVASVDDRDSYITERIDYLNHLFRNRAFAVAGARNSDLGSLDVLLPRVMLVVRAADGVGLRELESAVTGALPVPALRVRDRATEVERLGSDMYVYLARENMRIYLIGGVLMAFIGVFTVAFVNHLEDRRVLALLRTRGCGPRQMGRFLSGVLLGPSLLGLVLGSVVALLVGLGMTNLIWQLRELESVMRYLPTHLAVSVLSGAVFALLAALLVAVSTLFRVWVFRYDTQSGLA